MTVLENLIVAQHLPLAAASMYAVVAADNPHRAT